MVEAQSNPGARQTPPSIRSKSNFLYKALRTSFPVGKQAVTEGRTGERASEMWSYGVCASAREIDRRDPRACISDNSRRADDNSIRLAAIRDNVGAKSVTADLFTGETTSPTSQELIARAAPLRRVQPGAAWSGLEQPGAAAWRLSPRRASQGHRVIGSNPTETDFS